MQQELDRLEAEAAAELERIHSASELENWRVRYLGKKSALTNALRSVASLPPEEKKSFGARANALKSQLQQQFAKKEETLAVSSLREVIDTAPLDVSLPGRYYPLGRLHPITQVIQEICAVFGRMGFQVIDGPEVEKDYYNFEALNIPYDHPARDMFATLWIDSKETTDARLLRTHTSPMQVRIMEEHRPPLRFVVPGRTYRYEATDATHDWMFHQVEGLAVGPKGNVVRVLPQHLRKGDWCTFPLRLFPLRRARRRGCHRVLPVQGGWMPFVRRHRVARDPRLRNGASERLGRCWHRPVRLLRLCLRHGGRAHHYPETRG